MKAIVGFVFFVCALAGFCPYECRGAESSGISRQRESQQGKTSVINHEQNVDKQESLMNNTTALLVIDIQNDYMTNGKFPLWNAAECEANVVKTIGICRQIGMPVILVQHVSTSNTAPFFVPETPGVKITDSVRAAAPDAPVVIKHFADSFYQTELETLLQKMGIRKLLLAGMMTQNCVAFTALSKEAEKYNPEVLSDCCTTVSKMLHLIALNALSIRVPLKTTAEALPDTRK